MTHPDITLPGSRVEDPLLGRGTVQPTGTQLRAIGLILVLWDRDPPRAYNMGENPCAVFTAALKGVGNAG